MKPCLEHQIRKNYFIAWRKQPRTLQLHNTWRDDGHSTRFRVYLSALELQLLPVMHKVLTLENSTRSTLRTIIVNRIGRSRIFWNWSLKYSKWTLLSRLVDQFLRNQLESEAWGFVRQTTARLNLLLSTSSHSAVWFQRILTIYQSGILN